jgi:hypothetical protein
MTISSYSGDRMSAPADQYLELGRSGVDDPERQLLYHYTRAETALEHILPDGTLLLNSYREMRDPLENKELPLRLVYSGAPPPEALSEAEAREILGELRDRTRLLSLTTDATGYEDPTLRAFGRGYARPRMWEHYAAANTGVCLAFRAGALVGSFREELRRHGAVNCGPVEYTPGGFVTSQGHVLDADRLTGRAAAAILTGHLTDRNQDYWFLKLLDWETEYEYRFVLLNPELPSGEPVFARFEGCLAAIILGENFDPGGIPEVLRLGAGLGARVVQLDWRSGRPSVSSLGG